MTPAAEAADLAHELTAAVAGEVWASAARRAQYSSDASNYRVPPQVVVAPRDVDDLLAVVDLARRRRVPLTMRGAGTSVAGNAIGPGIVVDTSVHLNRVREIDADGATALVEPGAVLSRINDEARVHGLRFGPDPSTHTRATIGGVLGNNACGAHALAYGRAADNVVELDVVDGRGSRYIAADDLAPVPGLARLVRENLGTLRTEFGRFGRQVSGYSLEHLLPERGSSLARALVGTEGTVAVTLGARIRLVPIAAAPALVVVGYPDMAAAADAVPALLAHRPLAIEGLDARLVDVIRRHRGSGSVPELPAGGGWLLIEVGGATQEDSLATARALVADAGAISSRLLPAGAESARLWRIREDGAGLAGRTPSGAQAWPGWEDAAVPPARLGAYLRDFEALMARHDVEGLPYGHFGDGCVHVRLDLPLASDADAMRRFMLDAADLVISHGGSLSGEHGDGRARGELLSKMYSAEALELLGRFKALLDPDDVLNPGIIVEPAPLDADLRRPAALPLLSSGGFAFADDGGDFTQAVHRCVGVGKCRAVDGGFMCPSFRVSGDENDVTRGRARTLQEMANGSLIEDGWRAAEVHGALDLCLSCKACSSECPAGVDMAQYKSEVLHRSYRGRVRPRAHYLLGWLPRWARLAGIAPGVVNAVMKVAPLRRALLRAGGIDPRRGVPAFASRAARRALRDTGAQPGDAGAQPGDERRVVLWGDSFSAAFRPASVVAMRRVLHDAGYTVIVPRGELCCGLTWISTGQLDGARRRLRQLVDGLAPYALDGVPIVGVEPSCTAVLRSDLGELLPEDSRARSVAAATVTLAELLERTPGWSPPDLSDLTLIVQPHCHHHAVIGFEADRRLLARSGAEVQELEGCCGMAGNFGMEQGHYETSVAVAELALLPALRAGGTESVFLADGFSCRTQAEQLADVQGRTLAELLVGGAEK
ncbi:FAD-binding oxidoreductase [Microbacterium esteraromaticum]|uniref:FAD-binding oxidoreductase n=1 Tax=Microbacterium esteraromaticum TaxID=57043 RepID=A0A7D8A9L7_9MICO|nr:FAD-binding and (Fe-S)-binding domain-containing protein [Microbacterium esteraromaticum]QMU95924.1 FAD-binding oxidoreductase [Microbacterium esteraromaticum]